MKIRYRFAALALVLMLLVPQVLPARAEKNTGMVRVLLTRLNLTNRMEVSLDGSYTLNELSFQRGCKLTIAISGAGKLMVYYEGMALDAGKQLTLVRHAAEKGQENGLRINGAYELHPGDLAVSIRDGQLRAVLHAPVEEYLLGVVPYEMSDSFPVEALKAQAIAARTYALRKVGSNQDYDVVDNTNDQAYYGVKAQNVNAAKAVKETEGLCGFYKGALAECFYSASNGGQTELASHVWGSGDYSYLVMADDPYDLENPESTVKQASLPKKLSSNDALGALKAPVLGALSEILESRGYDGDMEHIRVTGIAGAETALPLYTDSPTKIMTLLRLSLTVQARRLLADDGEEEISIFTVLTGETPAPTEVPEKISGTGERWSAMETLPQPVLVTLDIFPLVESALDLSINGGRNELITVRRGHEPAGRPAHGGRVPLEVRPDSALLLSRHAGVGGEVHLCHAHGPGPHFPHHPRPRRHAHAPAHAAAADRNAWPRPVQSERDQYRGQLLPEHAGRAQHPGGGAAAAVLRPAAHRAGGRRGTVVQGAPGRPDRLRDERLRAEGRRIKNRNRRGFHGPGVFLLHPALFSFIMENVII